MARHEVQYDITVATSEAASTPIPWDGVDGGHFDVTSGSTATITWYVSKDGTTYKVAKDENGSDVTSLNLSTTYDFVIPTTLNGRGGWLKAVATSNAGVIAVGKKRSAGPG